MEFQIVLNSTLTMLAFMVMGYALVKLKLASPEHGRSLSSVLVYLAMPGLLVASFQEMEYSPENAKKLFLFFAVSLGVHLLMFLITWLMFGRKFNDGKYRILSIASCMGNVGFFGQPVIRALFPDSPLALCYCVMIAASMNILIFTIGEFMISRQRKYITLKRVVFNPTIFVLLFVIPMYFLRIRLPLVPYNVAASLRSLSAPLCMLVLGFRLASMRPSDVFCQPFGYLAGLLKLIVFPLIAYAVTLALPVDRLFRMTMLITAGTPCASVILSLAEVHNCEQDKAAYSVLMTTILCVVSLPLLALVFS